MLETRIIPLLLYKKGGLYKTIRFAKPNYIGDPINAVRIFNEKEVDEIIVLDIEASLTKKGPDFKFIQNIASECFMPLTYGGGVSNVVQMKRLFRIGIEKVCLNTYAYKNPSLVSKAAKLFGSQAIIISIDIKKNFFGKYSVYIKNGTVNTGLDPVFYAQKMTKLGAGEIFLNNISLDGTMKGVDFDIIYKIVQALNVPLIACGGIGNIRHIKELIAKTNLSAVAVGSLFVYIGRNKGVLINYPDRKDIENIRKL
jgi:cyclase